MRPSMRRCWLLLPILATGSAGQTPRPPSVRHTCPALRNGRIESGKWWSDAARSLHRSIGCMEPPRRMDGRTLSRYELAWIVDVFWRDVLRSASESPDVEDKTGSPKRPEEAVDAHTLPVATELRIRAWNPGLERLMLRGTTDAGSPDERYVDVPPGSAVEQALVDLRRRGVFVGVPGRRFVGARTVSPGEWAMTVERVAREFTRELAGRPQSSPSDAPQPPVFPTPRHDCPALRTVAVPPTHWSADAVSFVVRASGCVEVPQRSSGRSLSRYELAWVMDRIMLELQRKLATQSPIAWNREVFGFRNPCPSPGELERARLHAGAWLARRTHDMAEGSEVPTWTAAPRRSEWRQVTEQGRGPFRDVPENHPAEPSITRLTQQGIFTGLPDDRFHGHELVNLGSWAVALERLVADVARVLNAH